MKFAETHASMHRYIYIYIYIYIRGAFNKFPDFFVRVFKIVVDSWKFSMLLQYILWDGLTNFYDLTFKGTATAAIGIHLLKPDCHSWWISKMQSRHGDVLEERYAIKFCFKLGKNATETYGRLLAWIEQSVYEWHKRFKEGRDSVSDDERCGRSKEVNTPQLIGQG